MSILEKSDRAVTRPHWIGHHYSCIKTNDVVISRRTYNLFTMKSCHGKVSNTTGFLWDESTDDRWVFRKSQQCEDVVFPLLLASTSCWTNRANFCYHWLLQVMWDSATLHDDVIKWKHFPRYWPFERGIHRSPVNSPHKGQWRGALMFSLIWVWINGWVNKSEAGDLRRYRAHYDVTVMHWLYVTATWQFYGSCYCCHRRRHHDHDHDHDHHDHHHHHHCLSLYLAFDSVWPLISSWPLFSAHAPKHYYRYQF